MKNLGNKYAEHEGDWFSKKIDQVDMCITNQDMNIRIHNEKEYLYKQKKEHSHIKEIYTT